MSLSACGVLGVQFYTVPSGPGRFRRLPFPVAVRWSFPKDDRRKRKGQVLWTRLFTRRVAWLSRWNFCEHSWDAPAIFSPVCASLATSLCSGLGSLVFIWVLNIFWVIRSLSVVLNPFFFLCFSHYILLCRGLSLHKSWAHPSFSVFCFFNITSL